MKGIAISVVMVLALVATGWQISKTEPLPDVPEAPAVKPEDSGTVKTRRLEVVDESTGKTGMVFTVENGTCFITVNDNGKQRKVDLTKLARRL